MVSDGGDGRDGEEGQDGRTERIVVDGREIAITNPDKVLFPVSGHTKRDLVEHYRRIADVALPHYRGRPLSMHRFPDGIGGHGFFQKDAPDHFPDWITRAVLPKEAGTVAYVVADDAATLAYLATQAVITPHLSTARADRPHYPDRMIFDLDPSTDDFRRVQLAARAVRRVLDALEMPSFVLTTGSRGLHVVVPLDRSADYDDVKAFARAVAEHIATACPDDVTVELRKAKRRGRVFLDVLRNGYGATAVGAYAVRALEGAPVATPVRWDEALASDMHPRRYTMANIHRRLARIEDPWADMDSGAVSLSALRSRLEAVA